MTIVHHAGKGGREAAAREAQDVLTRRIYAHKHFATPHRELYLGAVIARHALRAALPGPARAAQRKASRAAIGTLLGRTEPPYGTPPATAVDVQTPA